MSKLINEIQRLQKIAGLLKEEDIDLSDTPQFVGAPKVPQGWEVEFFDKEFDPNQSLRFKIVFIPAEVLGCSSFDLAVYEVVPGKYFISDWDAGWLKKYVKHGTVFYNFKDAVKAMISTAEKVGRDIPVHCYPNSEGDLI